MTAIRIGILTVSDRASRGIYEDKGGPAIRDCLTEILSSPWEPVARVIPDERPLIESTLADLADLPAHLVAVDSMAGRSVRAM